MIADRVFKILQNRVPASLSGAFKPAAVLVPIQERSDGDYLILTQRSAMLNSHSGQIAFPGGRIDPQDESPLATALRESYEEIGIEPRDVRILGELDQVTAGYNFVVNPFVGLIPSPYKFRVNAEETAQVFSVPIAALLDPGCFSAEPRPYPSGGKGPIYHFYYRDRDIWGATARIIKQLLELAYGFEAREPRG